MSQSKWVGTRKSVCKISNYGQHLEIIISSKNIELMAKENSMECLEKWGFVHSQSSGTAQCVCTLIHAYMMKIPMT